MQPNLARRSSSLETSRRYDSCRSRMALRGRRPASAIDLGFAGTEAKNFPHLRIRMTCMKYAIDDTVNKALHLTAIPLRSMEAGKLCPRVPVMRRPLK